jgi:hypothetical protein
MDGFLHGTKWIMCVMVTFGLFPKHRLLEELGPVGSHYGRRSRGRRFSPIELGRNQEFGLSTLHTMAKVQRPSHFEMITFEEGDKLSKEVWVGREWKPKLWSRGRWFLFIK